MIKRLTLLKIAILTCVAISALPGVQGQSYKEDISSPTYKEPAWVKKTGARKFPSAIKTFSVNKYGAKGDGQTLKTKAIQSAIDACAAAGGGVGVFTPGSYVTGSLFDGLRVNKPTEYVVIRRCMARWVFNNVSFKGADGAELQVSNSENMKQ